jgi:hypothetical protein
MPTYEEFEKAVMKSFADDWKRLSDSQVENYIKSDEVQRLIHASYDTQCVQFKSGHINRETFIKGGVASVAYMLSMIYDEEPV